MERILTFAEFSKNFDDSGESIGNSPADIKSIINAPDEFTSPTQDGGDCSDSAPAAAQVAIGAEASPIVQDDAPDVIELTKVDGEKEEDSEETPFASDGEQEQGSVPDVVTSVMPNEEDESSVM